MEHIPTESLTLNLIPTRDAAIEEIEKFVFTFDGYGFYPVSTDGLIKA